MGVCGKDRRESNPDLRICHDVCIGTKHLRLNSPKASGAQVSGGALLMQISPNPEFTKNTLQFKICWDKDRKYEDAYEVAARCVATWTTFINDQIRDRGAPKDDGTWEQ